MIAWYSALLKACCSDFASFEERLLKEGRELRTITHVLLVHTQPPNYKLAMN